MVFRPVFAVFLSALWFGWVMIPALIILAAALTGQLDAQGVVLSGLALLVIWWIFRSATKPSAILDRWQGWLWVIWGPTVWVVLNLVALGVGMPAADQLHPRFAPELGDAAFVLLAQGTAAFVAVRLAPPSRLERSLTRLAAWAPPLGWALDWLGRLILLALYGAIVRGLWLGRPIV